MTVIQRTLPWLGILLTLGALWPLWHALDAIGGRDYLGGLLLGGLTWVIARSGVELASLAGRGSA